MASGDFMPLSNGGVYVFYSGAKKCRPVSWVFPKIGGTPKQMVYHGNPIKMDDLGGYPPGFGNIHLWIPRLNLDYFPGAFRSQR